MQIQDVSIKDSEIRLGQFIKLANFVETGGLAKEVIAGGAITVNGEIDTRRGKVLRPGDEVGLIDPDTEEMLAVARVVNTGAQPHDDDDLGEYFDESTADDDFDPEKWRNM